MLKRLLIPVLYFFLLLSAQARDSVSDLILLTSDGLSHSFQVELADTPASRAQGLMFRTELAPMTGMIFDFGQQAEIGMWMKNTPISLDILFIRQNGEVVNIRENAEPMSLQRIYSEGPVRATLELAAGTVMRLGIKAGDRVIHPIFGNQ